MGLLERIRPRPTEPQTYQLVDSGDGYAIATELAEKDDPRPKALVQISGKGESTYARMVIDYNPDFIADNALRIYEEMRTDSSVRNSLRIAKSPVIAARWFMQPYAMEQPHIDIAKHLWNNLQNLMTTAWPEMLIESLNMLDYGVYVFEPVWDIFDGLVVWRKFVPIHPTEIAEFQYDNKDGGIAGIKLADEDETEIDIGKLLIFTYDKEGGDCRGRSLLRSAHKNWFYKETLFKIDAIQKERHGIGIPIIKLPTKYGDAEIREAHDIGEMLRTNEKAHVVLPPHWELIFAKLEGQPVDALESAKYHVELIYENVLANFVFETSNANYDAKEQTFMRSSRFTAEIIRTVWNKYAIPRMVRWNWGIEEYPELKVRRLGDTIDWRTISFAMRNFAGMGAITPDEPLEQWIREEMDLPDHDPTTARDVPTPQRGAAGPRPPQPGMPRQSQAQNQDSSPGNNANVGQDNSGSGT